MPLRGYMGYFSLFSVNILYVFLEHRKHLNLWKRCLDLGSSNTTVNIRTSTTDKKMLPKYLNRTNTTLEVKIRRLCNYN